MNSRLLQFRKGDLAVRAIFCARAVCAGLMLAACPNICAQPNVAAVLNGVSFQGAIAQGTPVSIFGSNLAAGVFSAVNLPLPTVLSQTTVLIGGVPAPLYFVSPLQINAQVPFEVSGSAMVIVSTAEGASAPVIISVGPAAPSIFAALGNGRGNALIFDPAFKRITDPLPPGSILVLYAAGLGQTNPTAANGYGGASNEPFNRVQQIPEVYIGEQKAQVLFAGLAPGFCGVYQLNVQAPSNIANDRLYLQVGSNLSNSVLIPFNFDGVSTSVPATGSNAGLVFSYDSGAAPDEQLIESGTAIGNDFYLGRGLGNPGTVHVFSVSSAPLLSGIYAQWFQLPLVAAQQIWADGATAVSGPSSIFISTKSVGWSQSSSPQRQKIVAHELYHILQYGLAGQLAAAPTWMREGSAEYMGYRAVAAKGLYDFANARAGFVSVAASSTATLQSLETVSALASFDSYSLGFLAIDSLVGSGDIIPVSSFWSYLGQGQTWQDAFKNAFGISSNDFYAKFAAVRATDFGATHISGMVTDSARKPYANISVYACPVIPGACGYALTDSGGSYRVIVSDGNYLVQFGRSNDGAHPDGYYSTSGFVANSSGASTVTIKGNDLVNINVQLPFASGLVPAERRPMGGDASH